LPFDTLRFPLAIPVWDQYVDFLKWVLSGIGDAVGSGGVAIIIFTIIVRTLILPITVRSIKSMKAMQDIQPKIKELQKKHKGDRMKIQQETMALYQTYGVNPIAGCLPALLQLPIFFGVYRAILSLSNSDTGVWHGGFLWLDSLKNPDPWHLLPILAGIFQLMQTFMSRPHNQGKVTDPQQAMMNTMMNIMPITVVLFGWSFASGAVIYWVTQSIYGIIQQWFITGWGKLNDYIPSLPELPEHKRLGYRPPQDLDELANRPPKKKGVFGRWWEQQMQHAQKMQEERKTATAGAGAGGGTATATAGGPAANAKRSGSGPKAPRPYARNSPKGRMLAEQARRAEEDAGDVIDVEADIVADDVRDADISANGTGKTPPKRTRRAKK
jgi:YidC/Oxa1 family membrane protein insertase